MNNYNLKKVLCQLNQWCATNNVSVQSVYDEGHGMTLQELVYYLLGIVKETVNEWVGISEQFNELYNFVNNYFNSLDLQNEVNKWLDNALEEGILPDIIITALKNKLTIVNTVKDLQELNCNPGDIIETLGYYNINDGGGAKYIVSETESGWCVHLNNDLYAITFKTNNVLSYGIKNDGSNIYEELQSLITWMYNNHHNEIYFPAGTYKINNPLNIYYSHDNFWQGNGIKIIGEDIHNTIIKKESVSTINEVDTCIWISTINTNDDGSGVTIENLTIKNNSTFSESYCITGNNFCRSTFKKLNLFGHYGIKTGGYSNVFKDIISFTKNTTLWITGGTSNIIEKIGSFSTNNPYIINCIYSSINGLFGDSCTGDFLNVDCWGSLFIGEIGTESPELDSVIKLTNTDNYARSRNIFIGSITCFNLSHGTLINIENSNVSISSISVQYNAPVGQFSVVNFNNSLVGNLKIDDIGFNSNVYNVDFNKVKLIENGNKNNVLTLTGRMGILSISGTGEILLGNTTSQVSLEVVKDVPSLELGVNRNATTDWKSFTNTDITYLNPPKEGSLLVNKGDFPSIIEIVKQSNTAFNTSKFYSIPYFYIGYSDPDESYNLPGCIAINLTKNTFKIYLNGWKTISIS